MAWDWIKAMDKKEMKHMKDFIVHTFDGFQKWGDDRFVNHILYIMVREITRTIGEYKNLKMSAEAKKELGECSSWANLERRKKEKGIIMDHDPPAKQFFDELTKKVCGKESFTAKDAERWLKEASMTAITKEEDQLLTSHGYVSTRPPEAYEELGIKKLDVWK